jgi:hypothetical protein
MLSGLNLVNLKVYHAPLCEPSFMSPVGGWFQGENAEQRTGGDKRTQAVPRYSGAFHAERRAGARNRRFGARLKIGVGAGWYA